MLQLRDLPTPAILQKFAQRYPDADVSAVATFLHLLRTATDLSVALDACLQQHALLQGRWWVLILLMREENVSAAPSELADKAGVTRATMTGLLDGLERDGLVERLSDEQDRRRYTIRLTAAGQAKLDEVMPDYYQRVRRLMQPLDENQRRQFIELLDLILAGADGLASTQPATAAK
jgi:DNA-binding MarR family transcriptional regulator